MSIRSFRHKGLAALWNRGSKAGVRPDLIERVRERLTLLHVARNPQEMDVPGFDFHRLRGTPVRYTIHVNGPMCITFEWQGEDAIRVDLENYH